MMTLSAVVLLIVVEFRMELMDWLVLLDLVIQGHVSLGVSELFSPIFQDSLILCASTSDAYISEFLEPAFDYIGVFR